MTRSTPRGGMMAVVRNRRAMIMGVQSFDVDEAGDRASANIKLGPSVERMPQRIAPCHKPHLFLQATSIIGGARSSTGLVETLRPIHLDSPERPRILKGWSS